MIAKSSSSGHEVRSSRTRTQLVEAAIEVIGAVGYEAASTRILAKTAQTTLSAIPYHFGGKKELYLAAAEMIADYAANRFEEAIAVLASDEPFDGMVRFEQALTNLLDIMLDEAEPHSWTAFIARCTYDNDEAFVHIYDRAIGPTLERLTEAAAIFSPSGADEALRLRISAILTAIVGFRVLRGIMLRSMGWNDKRNDRAGQIKGMIQDLCRSDFLVRCHLDDSR